jgi:hypothetical protein
MSRHGGPGGHVTRSADERHERLDQGGRELGGDPELVAQSVAGLDRARPVLERPEDVGRAEIERVGERVGVDPKARERDGGRS